MGTIFLRCSSESLSVASFFLLAIYSVIGPKQRIQALVLSFFFSMLNPKVFPVAEHSALGRYVVFSVAALPALFSLFRRSYWRPYNILFALFALLAVLHSLLLSIYPDISFFKTVLFILAYVSITASLAACTELDLRSLEVEFIILLFGSSVVSAAMYLSGAGMLGAGLAGVFGQPQVNGIVSAIGFSIATVLIFGQPRMSWIAILLIVVFAVVLVLSRARTGLMSTLFGITLSLLLRPVVNARFVYIGLVTASLISLAWPLLEPYFGSFIAKDDRRDTLIEVAYASRGKLVETMLQNIQEHPYSGIGFGVSKQLAERDIKRDPFFGYAISAPVEKGVLPVAIIEELGVFVGVITFAWIGSLIISICGGPRESIAIALTAICTNLTESTLFSPSGLGILILIVLLWGAEKSVRSKSRDRASRCH